MTDPHDPDPIAMSLLWNREPISACGGHFPELYESHPMPKPIGGPVPTREFGPRLNVHDAFHLSDGRGRSLRVGSRIGPWRVTGVVRALPAPTVHAVCVSCCARVEAMESVLRREGHACPTEAP